MDELPYLSQVYAGLRDASIGELPMRHSPSSMLTQHVALRWLALIGYIHRDISVGNILVVTLIIEGKEEAVAQLHDFEYSRPILVDKHSTYYKSVN
jgi:hypothetical protein